jgi:heme/copper-type cytochrome/quinol oxidase subunit 1
MKNKPILIEIVWLLGSFTFTILTGFTLFGKTIFNESIDLNLHDTYFVIQSRHFLISFFVIISFFVYFSKELKYSFCRKIQRSIILLLGFVLIIAAFLPVPVLSFLVSASSNNLTVYPPLSLIADNFKTQQESVFSLYKILYTILVTFQLLIIVVMLYVSYRWGRSKNNQLTSEV